MVTRLRPKRFTLDLDEDEMAELQALADEGKVSKSYVIRKLIRDARKPRKAKGKE